LGPYGISLLGHGFGLTALVLVSTLSAPHLFVGSVSIVLPPPGSGPGAAPPAEAGSEAHVPEPAPPEPPAPPPEERRRPQPEQNVVEEPTADGTLPPPKGDIPSLRPEARDPVPPSETPTEPVPPVPTQSGRGRNSGQHTPGGSSSVGEGTGIGVEGGVLGAHAPWYLVAVHDKIKSNWDFPAMVGREGEVQAIYRFRIHQDGRVTDVQAEHKSSIMTYDMAAHRAIVSAAPLPPVPEELGHEEIVITVTFTKVY
jgi:TonB family protein